MRDVLGFGTRTMCLDKVNWKLGKWGKNGKKGTGTFFVRERIKKGTCLLFAIKEVLDL